MTSDDSWTIGDPGRGPSGVPTRGWREYSRLTIGLFLFGATSLLALLITSALLWIEMQRRFPSIEPGSYRGQIQGVMTSADNESVSIVVRREAGKREVLLAVFRPDWSPQVVPLAPQGPSANEDDWMLPVIIKGAGQSFSLQGKVYSEGSYGGKIVNVETGSSGTWEISKITDAQATPSPSEEADVKVWLSLKSELNDLEERIATAERVAPAQKVEIEELTKYITEGEELKKRGNERFEQAKLELSKVKIKVVEKRKEVSILEDQFEISEKFTPMGKLVSLSRESLERESRWLDSFLRTGAQNLPKDLDQSFDKGMKILTLKEDIAAERARLQALRSGDASAVSKQQHEGTTELDYE